MLRHIFQRCKSVARAKGPRALNSSKGKEEHGAANSVFSKFYMVPNLGNRLLVGSGFFARATEPPTPLQKFSPSLLYLVMEPLFFLVDIVFYSLRLARHLFRHIQPSAETLTSIAYAYVPLPSTVFMCPLL
jgi:hypothetical protein